MDIFFSGGSIGSEADSKWRRVNSGEVRSEKACKLSQTGQNTPLFASSIIVFSEKSYDQFKLQELNMITKGIAGNEGPNSLGGNKKKDWMTSSYY